MQAVNFDDQTGYDIPRKRQYHAFFKSKGISYPSGATKDRCIKIAKGEGIDPLLITGKTRPAIAVSDDEIAAFDLSSKKRTELMAMGSKLGLKITITMKRTEILAAVEKALDE